MASDANFVRSAVDNPNNTDSRLLRAIDEITTFGGGQNWSVYKKSKSLSKFGRRAGLGATASTVAALGGEDHETLLATNGITTIVSSSAADTQSIKVEYHTLNAGADELTFGVQTVTLTGQTPVPLPVPCARVSRAYNNDGTELVGDIYIYEGGTITVPANGPDDATEIHIQIVAGDQQSKKAATSISNTDVYFITGLTTSVVAGTPGSQVIDFDVEIKALDGVWLPRLEWSAQIGSLSTVHLDLDPVIIVPKNHDVRIVAVAASGTGVDVSATFRGYLAGLLD
jgi:hypothetical protein